LDRVGPPEDSEQAELVLRPLQLFNGQPGILQRDERYALQTSGVGTAVLGQPVVVGAADGRRGLGLDIALPDDVETDGREQDPDVDALLVHVAQVRWSVEASGDRLAEGGDVLRVTAKNPRALELLDRLTDLRQLEGVGDQLSVDLADALLRSFQAHPAA